MQCAQPGQSIPFQRRTGVLHMSKYMAKAMPLCQDQAVCFCWSTLLSANFEYTPSIVLLICVQTDPPVPKSQIPSVCIAAAAASRLTKSTRLVSELCQRQEKVLQTAPSRFEHAFHACAPVQTAQSCSVPRQGPPSPDTRLHPAQDPMQIPDPQVFRDEFCELEKEYTLRCLVSYGTLPDPQYSSVT